MKEIRLDNLSNYMFTLIFIQHVRGWQNAACSTGHGKEAGARTPPIHCGRREGGYWPGELSDGNGAGTPSV